MEQFKGPSVELLFPNTVFFTARGFEACSRQDALRNATVGTSGGYYTTSDSLITIDELP